MGARLSMGIFARQVLARPGPRLFRPAIAPCPCRYNTLLPDASFIVNSCPLSRGTVPTLVQEGFPLVQEMIPVAGSRVPTSPESSVSV